MLIYLDTTSGTADAIRQPLSKAFLCKDLPEFMSWADLARIFRDTTSAYLNLQ